MHECPLHRATTAEPNARLGVARRGQWAACCIVTAAMLMGIPGSASAAEIRVYSGGAPEAVLRALAPDFEAQSGHRIIFTFALVTDIQRKLLDGAAADLLLLPEPLLAATEKAVALRADGRMLLARVGIGVIVPQGATHPDIASADAVRTMLLRARRIALPDASVPSGAHLTRVMAEAGIADMIAPKLIYKAAIAGGAELVSRGEADVGLYLISEVRTAKGVSVVGLLPPSFQGFVVYAAALPASASNPDAALEFLRFVSAPANAGRWHAAGFDFPNQ
jgi:molybdate transport system substrate-binding protein